MDDSLDEKDVGSSGIFRVGQHAGGEVRKVVIDTSLLLYG